MTAIIELQHSNQKHLIYSICSPLTSCHITGIQTSANINNHSGHPVCLMWCHIKCCTANVRLSIPCLQLSRNRKAGETSNLLET